MTAAEERARDDERRARQEEERASMLAQAAWQRQWSEILSADQRIDLRQQRMRVDRRELQTYIEEGEHLRTMFEEEWKERRCSRCGHRFNYDNDDNVKSKDQWCNITHEVCNAQSEKDNSNPDCVRKQAAERRRLAREREAERKALLTATNGQTRATRRKPGMRSRSSATRLTATY